MLFRQVHFTHELLNHSSLLLRICPLMSMHFGSSSVRHSTLKSLLQKHFVVEFVSHGSWADLKRFLSSERQAGYEAVE